MHSLALYLFFLLCLFRRCFNFLYFFWFCLPFSLSVSPAPSLFFSDVSLSLCPPIYPPLCCTMFPCRCGRLPCLNGQLFSHKSGMGSAVSPQTRIRTAAASDARYANANSTGRAEGIGAGTLRAATRKGQPRSPDFGRGVMMGVYVQDWMGLDGGATISSLRRWCFLGSL